MEHHACLCEKDADGECPSCKGKISAIAMSVTTNLPKLLELLGKMIDAENIPTCSACHKQYADWIMSMVLKLISGMVKSESIAKMFVSSMKDIIKDTGVIKSTPLLDKAWRDLREQNLWDMEA